MTTGRGRGFAASTRKGSCGVREAERGGDPQSGSFVLADDALRVDVQEHRDGVARPLGEVAGVLQPRAYRPRLWLRGGQNLAQLGDRDADQSCSSPETLTIPLATTCVRSLVDWSLRAQAAIL